MKDKQNLIEGAKGALQDTVESSISFEANFEANFEDAFAANISSNQAQDQQSSTAAGISNQEQSLEDNDDDDGKQMLDCNDAQPPAPKHVVGGRASIPEELDSNQLARLQNLKESNA